MNKFRRFSTIASAAILFTGTSLTATAGSTQDSSGAKVNEADARAKALAAVPSGVIQSAELETEHGKLVWSFDIKI